MNRSRTMAKLFIIGAVLALAFALPQLLFATPIQGADEIPTFDAFLQGLSGQLVAVAVGLLLSVIVEWIPAYDGLAARYKRLIFFGLCLIVPVAAAFLRWALGYVSLTFDPLIWHAIWNGLGAAGVGTLVHTRKLPVS
jgi:hypothetical protein